MRALGTELGAKELDHIHNQVDVNHDGNVDSKELAIWIMQPEVKFDAGDFERRRLVDYGPGWQK